MILDEKFWLLVGFVSLGIIIWRPVKKSLLAAIDKRILEVKKQASAMKKSKKEAEKLLEQLQDQVQNFQAQQRSSMQKVNRSVKLEIARKKDEMEQIMDAAKKNTRAEINAMQRRAAAELEDKMKIELCVLLEQYFASKDIKIDDLEIARALKGDE